MENFSTPRILLSGSAGKVGKSLVGIGLAVALRKRGLSLSCCVVGSNLHQASIYRRISGRFVRTLDGRLLTRGQLLASAFQAGVGADLILIEGQGGLFDGWSPEELRGSDAEIMQATFTPVVLVVDISHMGASLAALVKGYAELVENTKLVGVVANQARAAFDESGSGSAGADETDDLLPLRDREYFDEALEAHRLDPLIGFLPHIQLGGDVPPSRVQQRTNATLLPRQFYVDLANLVERSLDLDSLVTKAQSAPVVRLEDYENQPLGRRTKIAVSDDTCFNVGFQDNLDLLRYYGAEVSFFSPLADSHLPGRTGAVYLTGGYLQEYGKNLAQNDSMHAALRAFIDKGGVVYAEGSGAAYLCEEIWLDPSGSERVAGVGVLPGIARPSPSRHHYEDIRFVEDSILGPPGTEVRAISTYEWTFEATKPVLRSFSKTHAGGREEKEGFSPGAQVIATFSFLHWGSNPTIAKALVDSSQVVASF